MKYYIDLLDNGNGAMVYTQVTKPEDIAHLSKVGASPEEAIKRLMAEEYHKSIVVRSADQERFGVWYIDFTAK